MALIILAFFLLLWLVGAWLLWLLWGAVLPYFLPATLTHISEPPFLIFLGAILLLTWLVGIIRGRPFISFESK